MNIKEFIKEKLKNIDVNKLNIKMQYDGIMIDTLLNYSELKNKDIVLKSIKDNFDIDTKNVQNIKIYENLKTDFVGDVTSYSFRIYLAELWLDKNGNDIIDFCADYVPETIEDFNNLMDKLKL